VSKLIIKAQSMFKRLTDVKHSHVLFLVKDLKVAVNVFSKDPSHIYFEAKFIKRHQIINLSWKLWGEKRLWRLFSKGN